MGKLSKEKVDGRDQRRRRDDELALTVTRPTKRQKKPVIGTNDLLALPTRLCKWLFHKFTRPLPSMPPSILPAISSSSELILFNSSSSNASAFGSDLLQSGKYDVFLSFRGIDVRNSFLSHLYSHLNDSKKLAVYKDDVDLERGERISPALLQAIEGAGVYIVILSPNYAASPWCLEELEKILECKERYGRRVIPVFFGVDPSDVESQKLPSSTCGKIRSWRAALEEIANISGFDSQVISPETALIDEITRAVFQAIRGCSQMVKFSSYFSSRGLVGVEGKMQQVQWLLCSDERCNRTIGLWGMAGIGKTVLAKAFFDLFSSHFKASYFFSNFADAVASGLSIQPFGNLQSHFFSKLLGDDGVSGTLSYDLTLHRVGRMKALVVIDDVGNDVGNIGPLKDLLNGRYCDLFGPGSIMILTSRNKQLLKNVCHHVYEVGALNYGEAFRLFCLHAFKGGSPQTEYLKKMVQRAVNYAGGNPLAITVLGSHLYGRDLNFWERELDALQDHPNPVVENVLRRSYDVLSRAEKDVFLDLACFYSSYWCHMRWKENEEMLFEGGRVNVTTSLIDKSLVRIDTVGIHSYVEMDVLLQDLGRSIVNEECQIGKRSRLWKAKDVYYLFKENKGSQSVEGILWGLHDKEYLLPDTYLKRDTFEKMENLRFLVVHQVICNLVLPKDGLKCLPNALRILEWHFFASKYLPSQFSAENLVTLNLENSKVEQLWECELNVNLRNLKSLNLSGCKRLRKLPNLSAAKKLVEIYLWFCVSLVELPPSILELPKLELLYLSRCSNLTWSNLEHYADGGREQNRRHLDILPNLKKLFLSRTQIQKVPDFVIRLNIVELRCTECRKLTKLPVIPSLEILILSGSLIKDVTESEKLMGPEHLPVSIGNLTHLRSLDLSDTAIEELPSSIGDLTWLHSLLLNRCKNLASLPDTFHKLSNLNTFGLSRCEQLTHLPELPSSLTYLDAHGCKSLQTLPSNIEKHDLSHTKWQFGQCWKLDPVVCSKVVDKFTQDLIRTSSFSHLLLPAKWGSESDGEGEGSIMGSNNKNNNITMVTVVLRGQPWKIKSLILCALLDSPPLPDILKDQLLVECVLLSNNKNTRTETVVSSYYWTPVRQYEDEEERLSRGYLLVWSMCDSDMMRAIQSVIEKTSDDDATVEFFFRGHYKSKRHQSPNLIKNCRVIPAYNYNARAVTYVEDEEEEEEEDDDDDDQSPDKFQGLYDQLCHGQ